MIENSQNISSDYEEEKWIKKLKITRNEFKTVGKYGMPLIKKQDIDLDKINLWNYTKTKNNGTPCSYFNFCMIQFPKRLNPFSLTYK